MGRTSIDNDDELLERVVCMYASNTKSETVQLALEQLIGDEPMSIEEQLAVEGVGWDGDLDAMRSGLFMSWGQNQNTDASA